MQQLFKNILVPYDGQQSGEQSFDTALKIAKQANSNLFVLTCLHEPTTFGFFKSKTAKQYYEKQKSFIEKKFLQLKNRAKNAQVVINTKTKKTDLASKSIIDYAKDNNIDLIVMSKTKPQSIVEKIYYESTVDKIFKTGKCSVLISK